MFASPFVILLILVGLLITLPHSHAGASAEAPVPGVGVSQLDSATGNQKRTERTLARKSRVAATHSGASRAPPAQTPSRSNEESTLSHQH
jgi:hypothetical protein